MSAATQSMAGRGLKSAAVIAIDKPHGTRIKYMGGCRCDKCRRANTDYEKERAAARKTGDWNGIVTAGRARVHMLKLSKQGVGRRSVQAVTDIADSILHKIRSGTKLRIRARTERLILAVTKEMAADGALVDAAPTWKLINKLLAKGYTKSQIALALGAKTPALQIRQDKCEVRTAYEVARFYAQCKKCDFATAAKRADEPVLPAGTYSPRPGVLVHRMGDA